MANELIITREGSCVVVTINRERARNALNDATLNALMTALEETSADGTRAVIVTGSGTKAFSAGSDIKEMATQTTAQRIAHTELGQVIAERIESHPAITIAAIEGFCLGGGLELSLPFDLRIVGEGSTLGLPELRINALPSWGGMARLPRILGITRAKEVILFGRQLNAHEAVEWGLAAEVTAAGGALARALEIASGLAKACNARTYAIAKSVLTRGIDASIKSAVHMELLADMSTLSSSALDEGVSHFLSRKEI